MFEQVNQRILLVLPPFVQLNTAYPATTYLNGFLKARGFESHQTDLSIEVILSLFSSAGLTRLFQRVAQQEQPLSDNSQRIFNLKEVYVETIDAVISFLQNENPTLAHRIASRHYLPEAARFAQTDDLDWAFGTMGIHDKARHLATLYLEDISDLIVDTVDPHFGVSRYAEKIAMAASSFDLLDEALQKPATFIDELMLELLEQKINEQNPTIVGFTVPFPGNLYSALRCGQWLKQQHPHIHRMMGGGYPNTELRSLSDSRVFEYTDFIILDDGERPLLHLIEHLNGQRTSEELTRTFVRHENNVVYRAGTNEADIHQNELGTPDFTGLPLKKYLSVIETANPMHSLWSDGRWNKLTLAHGCYWARCSFCDTSLDYIARYQPAAVGTICDRMQHIVDQTGESGFHFVDEAAPPALLKALALEIIRRRMNVTWWTNVRFEKSYTADLCLLLKESGCIAVSGGLEVATDRLLKLINKGVTVEQVSQVVNHFTQAGIMVHAYLMYGFPTQTAQETIDALETVRQLFEAGIVHSAFWHHFALTAHSPIGLNPEKFQVRKGAQPLGTFANNELECIDPKGTNHAAFGEGLRKSLFNYMHQIGFDFNLQQWFDFKIPKTTLPKNYIRNYLEAGSYAPLNPKAKCLWLGRSVTVQIFTKNKKGVQYEMAEVMVVTRKQNLKLGFEREAGLWLAETLNSLPNEAALLKTMGELETDFEAKVGSDFVLFWNSKNMQKLRQAGLLAL
jgi:hypothetical protein